MARPSLNLGPFTEFGPDASQADVLAAAAGQLSAEQERALALKDAS